MRLRLATRALAALAVLIAVSFTATVACGASEQTSSLPVLPESQTAQERRAPAEPPPPAAPSEPMTAADFATPPDRDLLELARQLRWNGSPPESQPHQFAGRAPAVGDAAEFWIANLAEDAMERKRFRLAAISNSAYWWVENGLQVDDADLQSSIERAEAEVYPRVTEQFGAQDQPGIDGLPRGHIINARLSGAGGYVSGNDGYPVTVSPFSNEIEAIYLNAAQIPLGTAGYLATLAHELQHAIHGYADHSEETWLNEGLSELAATEAGYPTGSLTQYLQRPNASLVNWPAEFGGDVGLNYGAASLFAHYLREHYATGDALHHLLGAPMDGIAGVNAFLSKVSATTVDGEPATFRTVFSDWIVANYLDSEQDRYGYDGLDVGAALTETRRVGEETQYENLQQYGVDYVDVREANGATTVHFEGAATTPLLSSDVPGDVPGGSCWWSNRGDSIATTLTRQLTVPQARPDATPAELSFLRWHDIEDSWDYVYVEASKDGGATWDVLPAEGATDENPMGNSYGHGYTGVSDWRPATVPLASYAGRKILLRFHYVTDDAIHGAGFCVREMRISGGDISDRDGGWQPDGFVLVNNRVRQEWIVWLITDGPQPTVTRLELQHDSRRDAYVGSAQLPVSAEGRTIVAVAPVAPATIEPGRYRVWAE